MKMKTVKYSLGRGAPMCAPAKERFLKGSTCIIVTKGGNNMVLNTVDFNNHTIEIVKGDITKEETEAIVNAANSSLQHGGGVALAIASAAGKELRNECEQYISQHGEVPTGSAMITTGGNLKAKYVIHTVGPIWGSGDEDEKLRNAIINS